MSTFNEFAPTDQTLSPEICMYKEANPCAICQGSSDCQSFWKITLFPRKALQRTTFPQPLQGNSRISFFEVFPEKGDPRGRRCPLGCTGLFLALKLQSTPQAPRCLFSSSLRGLLPLTHAVSATLPLGPNIPAPLQRTTLRTIFRS